MTVALQQVGGNAQYDAAAPALATLPTPPPATIASSGSYSTGLIPCPGYGGLIAAATLSQAGTLTIQRYLDGAGNFPVGAAVTQALTASTLGYAAVNDGLPCAFWQVTVSNSGGSTGNLTAFSLLQTRTI